MSDTVTLPRVPTEAMLDALHQHIDWCRDGQNTRLIEHPSQQDVLNGVTVGTTCRQDLLDGWAALLAAAGVQEAA